MSAITDAVILMAGSGSRLRTSGKMLPKPLVPVLGRPLISYIFGSLKKIGIKNLYAVVGFERDTLVAGINPLVPAGMRFHPIYNPDWQKQNGVSLLAAAPYVASPFLLLMSDHLFEGALLDILIRDADLQRLNLAIDKKLDSIFDISDAMKVQTRGRRLVAIGKDLPKYDAIDTGIFLCSAEIFDYLGAARRDNDCSLADGVRLMANDGKARAVDIGTCWWQDIDTSKMLEHATEGMRRLAQIRRGDPFVASLPHDHPTG